MISHDFSHKYSPAASHPHSQASNGIVLKTQQRALTSSRPKALQLHIPGWCTPARLQRNLNILKMQKDQTTEVGAVSGGARSPKGLKQYRARCKDANRYNLIQQRIGLVQAPFNKTLSSSLWAGFCFPLCLGSCFGFQMAVHCGRSLLVDIQLVSQILGRFGAGLEMCIYI